MSSQKTITQLRYHAGHGVAMQLWELLSEAVSSKRLLLRWVDEPLFEQA